MSTPQKMKAVVVTEDHWIKVEEVEVPKLQRGEVLVKVHVSGLNPTDWKHVKYLSKAGVISGCDYSGVVVEVGPEVEEIKTGDRLAGMVYGGSSERLGSFAEYAVADPTIAFKLADSVSYQQGATLGIPLNTAAQALYHRLQIAQPDARTDEGKSILIWSGATAVGFYAIQLAKLSGLTVYTTASPSNHELLKSLGADHIFDYKDPEVSKKIREASNDSISFGLDCISETDTQKAAAESFGKQGGTLVTLLFSKAEVRSDVKILPTLLYTALGKDVHLGSIHLPPSQEDYAFQKRWVRVADRLLADGKIKYIAIEERGGLEAISDAFTDMINGKNRATKYTFNNVPLN